MEGVENVLGISGVSAHYIQVNTAFKSSVGRVKNGEERRNFDSKSDWGM